MPPPPARPLRLLVVLPSWIGDAVMATPALRLLRTHLPGTLIGGLVRPGIDEVLADSGLLDQVHVERARGVMGPKIVASRVRPARYDAALLLTNSFSTALITRLAFIPRRIGYDRDGRGLLLTERLKPLRNERGYAPVSAVQYYLDAAGALVSAELVGAPRLELGTSAEDDSRAADLLKNEGIHTPYAILNPGGNNPAKRWPVDRFAHLAAHLASRHGLAILINGAPAESSLTSDLRAQAAALAPDAAILDLAAHPGSLGRLKALVRGARLMVTNDTGPRHISAAFGVPTVALFGPTDHRWTTLPDSGFPGDPTRETLLLADPTLPPDLTADDHPERCRIDRIETSAAIGAADEALARSSQRV